MTPKVPKQDGLPRPGPPLVATGGRGLPPKAVTTTSSGGLSDEAFRDAAIIAIYAAELRRRSGAEAAQWACREADFLLAERNRRRDERQIGRGRIEPARIVMDGERDRVAELEEQVRALRHALARELAELRARNDGGTHWDGCHESHPMCAAIQRIEAALVETDAKEKGKSSPLPQPEEPR